MKRKVRVGALWIQRRNSILTGVVVGLLTGILGLFATSIVASGNPIGGLAGAVGCGITVAILSEEQLSTTLLHATIADVLSSLVFYLLVFVVLLTAIAVTDGLFTALLGAAFLTPYYLFFGGILAVFIGSISVVITVITATVTVMVT